MNDLDLIRDLGETLDASGPVPHARMRARVVAGLTAERPPATSRRSDRLRPAGGPARRPLLWGVPLAAAATVAALLVSGALPVGGSGSSGPAAGPLAQRSEQVDRAALVAGEAAAHLDGRTILLAAADQAGNQPWTAPAADRFVYRRWTGVGWDVKLGEGDKIIEERVYHSTLETWISVDGTRTGVRYNSSDGFSAGEASEPQVTCSGPPIANVERDPSAGADQYCAGPGAVTDVPTDAAGALAYLRQPKALENWEPFLDGRPGSAGQRADDHAVASNALFLLRDHLVPPKSQAAIFQALASLPGFTVVRDVMTSTGRKAIAVGFTSPPADDGLSGRFEYLFDPDGHEFIGIRLVVNDPAHGIRDRVELSATIVENAILPTAGTRPDGSKAPAPSS